MEWSNETILRFLYLYKQYSVIWDPKHSEHKNKTTVAIAWQNLAENLNMGISVIDLKKKKDALMATYRHQQKKVQLARANGENYKPTWFCYYAMNNFLHDIYKPTGIPKGDFSDNQENNNYEEEEPKTFFEHSNFEFEDFELPEPEEPVEEKPFIRKKRKMSSETKSQTDLEILPHTYTVPNIQMDSLDKVQEKDEISLFTELLATKLRKLDSTSRIIICNKIDNMMFEAELKLLQENKTRLDPLTQDVPTTSVESVEKKVLSSQSSPAGSEESASSE